MSTVRMGWSFGLRALAGALLIGLLAARGATACESCAEGAGAAAQASSGQTAATWPIPSLDAEVAGHVADRLGPAPRTHRTEHFVLVHPQNEAWAKRTGEMLERAHTEFYRVFSEAGFKLRAVEGPLVWVGLAGREEFDGYARAADRIDMSWSLGYYSARTNVVAVLTTQRAEAVADAGTGAPAAQVVTTVYPNDDASRASRVEAARATHELAHQLAFNSGLQRRGVMYPLWVAEGLATNFEADATGRITVGLANVYRKRALSSAWKGGRIEPLGRFVAVTRIEPGAGMISDTYAQCWGLFQFLLSEHPRELARYMESLAQSEAGWRDEWTMRQEFVQAFGSIGSLERRWHAYLARVCDEPEADALSDKREKK